MISRRRCQKGHARMRGRKTMYWEGVYYEYVTGLNGEAARERRFVFLGYLSELPNKRDAERKLGEMLAGINSLDYKPRSIVTLQEFFDSVYTETIIKHKKPSTRRDIQTGLRKHILPNFGSRQLTHISKLDLQRHFTGLIESGTLSWYTARKISNYLSGVYSSAINLECGVKSNPVSGIDLGTAPGHPDPGFLTDEEVAAVEEALPDQVSKTLWWLVVVVGVRTGEARALRWKAVDQKHGKLWINESRFEGQTHRPKSVRGKRGIDLSQHQLERLAAYRKLFPEATDDDFLFPSGHKWRTSPLCAKRLMNEVIKPTALKLGIPKVGWKMLRRWNSTVMSEEHFSDKVRQTRLGHASPIVTNEHYTVVRDSTSRRAAEAIDRRLEESRKNSPKNVGTNVGTTEEVSV